MLLKVAILVDLLRIFSPRGQRNLFFWTSHILLWANIVFYTTCTFLEVFSCQPREKRWNKLMPGGHCINVYALTVTVGSINFASDICILLLPQSIIWRLTMATPKKIGISAIFAVAILSVYRTSAIYLVIANIIVAHVLQLLLAWHIRFLCSMAEIFFTGGLML